MPLTNQEEQEIKEVFSNFGLHENDQKVFLAALQLGQSGLAELARTSSLPLTTTQSVARRLAERGLLAIIKHKSRHRYEPVDPQGLLQITQRQLKEMESVLPLLEMVKAGKDHPAKIKVYYHQRMADIFHEALKARNRLVYEIVSARDIQEILGEKFHFTRRRVQAGVHLKSLRIQSREIKKYSPRLHAKELREARFLPKEMTFQANILFWDHTAAFFSTKAEGLAFTVESRVISEFLRQIFFLLWGLSRPMITLNE